MLEGRGVVKRSVPRGRLNAIAEAAVKQGHVLAVLALGSSGLEQERIDQYSDLDVAG